MKKILRPLRPLKNQEEKNSNRQYVVFNSGKLKDSPRIVFAYVSFDGDAAFVRKSNDSHQASVVHKENVFKTKELAEKYLTSKGEKKWVVFKEDVKIGGRIHLIPTVFEANVMYYTYSGRYSKQHEFSIFRNGELISTAHRFNTELFSTKKEAEKRCRLARKELIQETKEQIKSSNDFIKLLLSK